MENESEEVKAANEELRKKVQAEAARKYKEVMDQREEITTAFIAKYKCEPDEIVQVEWRKSATEMLWFVVRKSDCIHCKKCNELMAEGEPRKDYQS